MTPFLTATEDGLWLSWLERVEDGHALRFSTWDGEGFGPPSTIHTSDHFFANWADFSSILSFGDSRLAAHWLEKAAEGTYEYDVFVALSEDGGKSWGKPQRPHRDGTLSEHGFVSLVADDASGFSAVWLDGREFKKGASDNEMTLRYTRFDGKAFTEDVLLDGRICECCQTGLAKRSDPGKRRRARPGCGLPLREGTGARLLGRHRRFETSWRLRPFPRCARCAHRRRGASARKTTLPCSRTLRRSGRAHPGSEEWSSSRTRCQAIGDRPAPALQDRRRHLTGRSSSPWMAEKVAALRPMPSAKVVIAMTAKSGLFTSMRRLYCKSLITLPITNQTPIILCS